jgi:hypothetical protein
MDISVDNIAQQTDDLRRALAAVRQHGENAAPLLPISDQEIAEIINGEIAQKTIILDKDGLVTGVKAVLFGRVKEYLHSFNIVRQEFGAKFQTFQAQIHDFEAIPGKIASLTAEADLKIAEEKRKLDSDRIGEDYRDTKARYSRQIELHAHRPNLKAVSARFPFDVNPVYLIIMLMLGTAEWFINYDTLFEFFGIPIIAIGATLILALGLSVIAHQHGVDLKQWKRKFGPGVEDKDRPYGVLILATIGLIALITVTGWMRYQSLMSVIQSQSSANIVGTQFSTQINPEREVIISLGANLLAWLVGVFISYFAHDPDPIYVQTAIDFQKAERRYLRKKAEFDRVENRIKHNYAEQIEGEKLRLEKFETSPTLREAITMRDQVVQYEELFQDRAKTYFVTQYSRFRTQLLRNLKDHGDVALFRTEKGAAIPISLTDYQALPFSVSDEYLA